MDIRYVYIIAGIIGALVIFFLVWALFLRKRLGPPVEQVRNAEMALSDAKQKEADLYAQDEYQRAEDSLAKAKHLLAAKEYKKAKEASEDTIAQAGEAGKAIEENKAKMKTDNERMLSDFDKQVDELKQWAAKRGTDTPAKTSPEIQELIGKWEIMKVRLPDLIQRGRIREAHDELKAIEGTIQTQRQDFAAQTRAAK
jgi:hypothetical protein